MKKKMLLFSGIFFSALSIICYFAIFSTIGVIIDLRNATLIFAILAFVFSVLSFYTSEKNKRKYVSLLSIILGLIISALMLYELFFIYESREVSFQNDELILSGTLYQPKTKSAIPAVLLVHGSGRESRKEYEFYARMLARNGIAALAYDKRGVNQSGGKTYEVGYEGYAEDAYAGLQFLKSQPSIDENKVGIWGFSEGEWVAPLVAKQADSLAFMIVVSPSGLSPLEQVKYEIKSSMQRQGFSSEAIDSALSVNSMLTKYLRKGTDEGDSLKIAIQKFRNEPWYHSAELPQERYAIDEYGWWQEVMDFPALEVWSHVNCSVLLISGGKDVKSPVKESQQRIINTLEEQGNKSVTSVIFPKADHSITYRWLPGDMPPPVFPDNYPKLVADWIKENL